MVGIITISCDITNKYAWSMETFKGSIYIGTLNSLNESGVSGMIFGIPFKTYGAQIFQGNISQITSTNDTVWQWNKVLSDGNGNINNFGVRNLYAYGDYLFGVTAYSGQSLLDNNKNLIRLLV